MPTYSYRCTECDNAFDIQQSFTDDTLSVCPVCGGKLRKVFSPIGVSFTGSGFYRNDSRASSGKGEGSKSAGGDSSSSSGSGSGSGSGSSSSGSSSSGSSSSSSSSSSDSGSSKPAAAPSSPTTSAPSADK